MKGISEMTVRRAEKKDAERILDLLTQVLTIHANLFPDVFIPGTTKYSAEDLGAMFGDDEAPVYVAADDDDSVIGHMFCEVRERKGENMFPSKALYVDDLCIDAAHRGEGVGAALFKHAKREAARLGCDRITLTVWKGNTAAELFYEKMGMKPIETFMELKF